MNQRVLFREFFSRSEAEIVRELLLANGVESYVNADDCGATRPELAFSRGVQLYIAEEDAPLAEKILEESITDIPDTEDEED